MRKTIRFATIFALFLSVGMAQEKTQEKPMAPEASSCPMHLQQRPAGEQQHHEGVVQRGDEVMGFSHEKTTHHFRLYEDGGAIEVTANRADDTESRDAIRAHLGHIVTMFAAGNFSAPMLIHAQNPPGTEGMKRLKDAIQYKLETTERGARVRITTKNPDALRSVHEFLRFQIADHQTGDSIEVTKVL
jgi:hypothetical protein